MKTNERWNTRVGRRVPQTIMLSAAAWVLGGAASASAGIADSPLPLFSDSKPSQVIMSIPGVIKRSRLQTDFLCTSLASVPVDIGVQVFDESGTLQNNVHTGQGAILNVNPGQTVTFGTSATATYLESQVIPLAAGLQGSARVVASSDAVRCNSTVVDNALTPPVSFGTLDEGVLPAAGATPPGFPLPQFSDAKPATHAIVFPGVVKKGNAETAFFCTSLDAVNIDIGVQIFDASGTIVNSITAAGSALLNVAPGATVTFATTGTAALVEDAVIGSSLVAQGLARVVSTSGALRCAALILDAALAPPTSMSNLIGWGDNGPAPGATLGNALPQFSDTKPSVHIMTFTGVLKRDRLQTDFMCTSLASTLVDIGVEIFTSDGTLQNDVGANVGAVLNVAPGHTVTIGTSATVTFSETTIIPLNNGLQGLGRIVASSPDVRCNVLIVDDAVTPPVSLAALYPGMQPVLGSAPPSVPLPQFSNGHQATHSIILPGLVKRGDAETEVFCTSLAAGPIDIGVQVLATNGSVANSIAAGNGEVLDVAPANTIAIGTTGTASLLETTVITLAGIAQGAARIVSNSDELICSALELDAAGVPPGALSAVNLYGVSGIPDTPTPTATVGPSPTPTTVPVCGNGNIESGEQCDDGNTASGDGCDATCQLECPALVSQAKLIVNKIATPPGDDKVGFKGTVAFSTPVDPPSSGIRFVIEGSGGTIGEVYVNPGAGWTQNGSFSKWLYTNGSTIKIILKKQSTPNTVKFKLKVKGGGAFPVVPTDLPLTGYIVLDPAQCGHADFPGPAPVCAFNAAQSKVKCK